MLEYLIRPTEDDFINLHHKEWSKTLPPTSFASKVIDGWGNLRLEIEGCEISFSDEDVGIQVCFENCNISRVKANKIVQEICDNLVSATNQPVRIVAL